MKIPDYWSFDSENVAGSFDDHVREQLPWYDIATATVEHIVRHYLTEGGRVLDLGASTGNISAALKRTLEARDASMISVEASEHMREHWKGHGDLVIEDVRTYELPSCDVVVCFLLLMFLSVESRARLIERALAALEPGGCLVIVDKRESQGAYVGTVLSRLALAHKLIAGASPENIVKKELALSGAQRPLSSKELPKNAIEFFRMGDFSGWIIERR